MMLLVCYLRSQRTGQFRTLDYDDMPWLYASPLEINESIRMFIWEAI